MLDLRARSVVLVDDTFDSATKLGVAA